MTLRSGVLEVFEDGIKLLSDRESEAFLLTAVRELYWQTPASVQAFMLDVGAILQGS